jgi:hypothetical protein
VAKRATNRLIRQLGLACPKEVIGEAEFKKYMALFQGPHADKSIEAIRVTTRLADAEVAMATMALVPVDLVA